jgi:hypothetical protein
MGMTNSWLKEQGRFPCANYELRLTTRQQISPDGPLREGPILLNRIVHISSRL